MTLISPGRLYIQSRGTISTYEDILGYSEFLRAETGLDEKIPVDLQAIFKHFRIPEPKIVPLSNQQGLLLDHQRGIIVINAGDSEKRQKFTKAHELVEMLFSELPQGKELGAGWRLDRPGGFRESTKEFLCNRTAANLLIPPNYVQIQIRNQGVNFDCARAIAIACDVSLSATLVQLAHISREGHFVVLWRMKNKSTELKNMPQAGQLGMLDVEVVAPVKKLRVEWCLGGINFPFIPKDKSTERTSLISQAWETNAFTDGKERMTFDNRVSAWYYSENMPFTIEGERCVISLIRKI